MWGARRDRSNIAGVYGVLARDGRVNRYRSDTGQIRETQYGKALEIDPNHAEAHDTLGRALFQKGQLDEAIKQYQMALKINPSFAEAYTDLGVALFHWEISTNRLDANLVAFQTDQLLE